MAEHPCPDDAILLALALGELAGRERADALAHVVECAACRAHVQDLVETSEQVLLAAPGGEPPAGFESAVLARIDDAAPSRRRRWPVLAAAALVLVLVAAAMGIGTAIARDGGSELAEAAMITPAGRDVGRAWRYDAEPTWVLVSVPRWQVWEQGGAAPHTYRLAATLDDGSHVDLGALEFSKRAGAWGTTTSVAAARIRSVSVTDTTGTVWCRGEF